METQLERANVDNLIGLWQLMGAKQTDGGLHCSTRWPYRCWRSPARQAADGLSAIECIPAHYLFPVWHAGESSRILESALSQHGLEVGLEQLAMILPLEAYTPPAGVRLDVRLIDSRQQARQWSDLCGRAFGYRLDVDVIDQLRRQADVEVLWAWGEGRPLATAILYRTGPIMGVHQVGVPPELQGQRIAYALMCELLASRCIANWASSRNSASAATAAPEGCRQGVGYHRQG
jgi:hypothetical protein